jgi:hypothetical protein
MRKHNSKPANIKGNISVNKADFDPNNIRTSTNVHSYNYTTIIAATNKTCASKNIQAMIKEQKTRRYNIRAGNAKTTY